jgi:hypothetical protein
MAEREPAALRLLDVLLEEEMLLDEIGGVGPQACAPCALRPRSRPWVAAAMLAGIAVVVASAWLANGPPRASAPDGSPSRAADAPAGAAGSGEPAASRPQDPSPPVEPRRADPRDAGELHGLLEGLMQVRLVPSPPPEGVPILSGLPLLGRMFTRQVDAENRDGLQPLSITAPAELRQWRQALRGSPAAPASHAFLDDTEVEIVRRAAATQEPGRTDLGLELRLADGRLLVGSTERGAGQAAFRLAFGDVRLAASPELRQLLAAGDAAIRLAWRRRHGIAADAAELQALPPDSVAIECPVLAPAALRAELPRFTALERLTLLTGEPGQSPSGGVIAAIASVPTLRTLSLPAHALTDADVATLARSPLRRLHLTGQLPVLSARSFAAWRGLESLALDLTACESDLRAIAAALPALKVLAIGDVSHGRAAEAVLATKVERLALGKARAADLSTVAALPSLRELCLHDAMLGAGELRALRAIKGLRRLELVGCVFADADPFVDDADLLLRGSVVSADALRRALPDCEVTEQPRAVGIGTFVQILIGRF